MKKSILFSILLMMLSTASTGKLVAQSLSARFKTTVYCRDVVFRDSSTGNATSKIVYFGDGTSESLNVFGEISHTYKTTSDTFTACLVIGVYDSTFSAYFYDTACQSIVIDCDTCRLIAGFDWGHYVGIGCKEITFYNRKVDSKFSHYWRFGDGDTSTLVNPKHTYSADGWYPVTVTTSYYDSTISQTCVDSNTWTVLVACDSLCNISPSFTYTFDSVDCAKVYFANTTYNSSLYRHSWSYSDGGRYDSTTNTVHIYMSNGTYYAYLTVSMYDSANRFLCSQTYSRPIQITCINCGINADFSYQVDSADCYTIHFTNKTKDSSIYRYKWDFGDGSGPAIGRHKSHKFASNGTYYVKLLAYDTLIGKCRDSLVIPVSVLCSRCGVLARLDLSYDSTQPYKATLYNTSTGNINKHHWDFGDGTSSNLLAPAHTYNTMGHYTLTYVATDTTTGCSDTTSVSFTIDTFGNIKRWAFTLQVVDKTNTDVEQVVKAESMKLYPNPAGEKLFIENPWGTTRNIKVFSVHGTLVYESALAPGSSTAITVGMWSRGLYIVVDNYGGRYKVILQ